MIKSYEGLQKYTTYDSRLNYLILPNKNTPFGGLRPLNQTFYNSLEWRNVRDYVITRDWGNDLGISGYPIGGVIFVHHIRPITVHTLLHNVILALDPDNLITTSRDTHHIIHHNLRKSPIANDRYPGDTKLW